VSSWGIWITRPYGYSRAPKLGQTHQNFNQKIEELD
jgi:hypothetical protein